MLGVGTYIGSADLTSETIDVVGSGLYRIDSSTSPFGVPGLIMVMRRSTMACQVFFSCNSANVIGHRYKGGPNDAWSAWKKCTMTDI